MGKKYLNHFVSMLPEYKALTDDADKAKMKDEANYQFEAYLFMQNSDQAKYRSLMKGLVTQYTLDQNQYPKDLTKAVHVINQHKWDNSSKNKAKTKKDDKDKDKKKKSGEKKNSESSKGVVSFAQMLKNKRYCCSKVGHKSP